MNIKRGLLRLWVFGAVLWCLYWVVRLTGEFSRYEVGPTTRDVVISAAVLAVPPLLILAVAAGLYWALAGFRNR